MLLNFGIDRLRILEFGDVDFLECRLCKGEECDDLIGLNIGVR